MNNLDIIRLSLVFKVVVSSLDHYEPKDRLLYRERRVVASLYGLKGEEESGVGFGMVMGS